MKIPPGKFFVLIVCFSLILDWNVVFAGKKDSKKGKKAYSLSQLSPGCLAIAGAAGVVGIPAALWAAGFGVPGVAASSLASKLMSWTAYYYGGSIPATSMVAGLQSAGVAGVSYLTTGTVSALLAMGCELVEADDEDIDDEDTEEEYRHEEGQKRHEEEKKRQYEEEKNPQESIPYDKTIFVEHVLVGFYFFVILMVASQDRALYETIIIIISAIVVLGAIVKFLRDYQLHFLVTFCLFVIFKGVQILKKRITV